MSKELLKYSSRLVFNLIYVKDKIGSCTGCDLLKFSPMYKVKSICRYCSDTKIAKINNLGNLIHYGECTRKYNIIKSFRMVNLPNNFKDKLTPISKFDFDKLSSLHEDRAFEFKIFDSDLMIKEEKLFLSRKRGIRILYTTIKNERVINLIKDDIFRELNDLNK